MGPSWSTLSRDARIDELAPEDPPPRSTPFVLCERYSVEREIGRGGMGRIYLARDTRMNRAVAVKLLSAAAATPQQLHRLEQEARVVGSLGHPNIVAVYDIANDGGRPFIVEEFLEGTTLRQYLAVHDPSVDEALMIAVQIARGLGAAHDKRIVHCDLKPENVVVGADGWVKILDFGIARFAPGEGSGEDEQARFDGTLRYSSPEQIRGQLLDVRSDVFSFGILLYELLAHRVPFPGATRSELEMAILHWAPADLPPEVPQSLRSVVKRCLQKDPRNRFQTGADVAFALEAISAGRPVARWTRRRAVVALATAVPAAGALGTWYWTRRRSRAPTFRQLTYSPGAIWTGRFHADGSLVSYTEAWTGQPPRVLTTRIGEPAHHRVETTDAVLLSVSRKDDLAVIRQPRFEGFEFVGTLAVLPSSGGAARDVAEGVAAADWAGEDALAIVRVSASRQRLEFPIGTVVHESTGWISAPRLSPRGDAIAALDHPSHATDLGDVILVSRGGARRTLLSGWGRLQGLAWHPTREEVWFTGAAPDPPDAPVGLYAVTRSGRVRPVTHTAGVLKVHDFSAARQVLVTQPERYLGIVAVKAGAEVDLSVMDQQLLNDISRDGSRVLLTLDHKSPDGDGTIYVRPTSGGPPVRIASGYGGTLAPDGKTALVFSIAPLDKVSLVPIGSGQSRTFDRLPFSVSWARFFPDGERVLLAGEEGGRATRLFVFHLRDGAVRPISPEGVDDRWFAISPGGVFVAGALDGGGVIVVPATGGDPLPLPGTVAGDKPYGWIDDSTLLVGKTLQLPLQIDRVDVATGDRRPWKVIRPEAPGVHAIRSVSFAENADTYAYSHVSMKTHLYLMDTAR